MSLNTVDRVGSCWVRALVGNKEAMDLGVVNPSHPRVNAFGPASC
jgi:hypothetical protein